MKKLRVTVDGRAYEVVVEEIESGTDGGHATVRTSAGPSPAAASVAPPPVVAAAPPSAGPSGGGDAGAIGSPLAGRVVSVDCAVGQAMTTGAKLVTLEAMKMNTYIYADRDGSVTAIHVQAGDSVEEGQALVTLS